ncbi:MAG: sensor domain-containing protein [Mycobacteriaceae bacterium]|nr:sensor domain-containing protein [Mycobacteriaceae bacterium]
MTAAKRPCRYLRAATVLVLVAAIAGCSKATPGRASAPSVVPASALEGLLLSASDINAVMGTTAIVANTPFTNLGQHSNLLPNKNCLGIWEVGEDAIYRDSKPTAFRGQDLQQPATGAWDAKVVQGVAVYPGADASGAFFAASADRWSKCTNHHVNMTVNDQPMPKLFFGNLTKTDTQLAIPVVEGEGDGQRQCQRVLSVADNLIIDVAACSRTATDQAATIAGKIKDRIGR